MNFCECQRSRSFNDLCLRSLELNACQHYSNDFSSETTGPISIKFHMQHLGSRGSEICSNGPGHIAKMASMIIYGKNLKKTFFSRTTGLIALI